MPLEDELYKALLVESRLYREKVSTIWLQKFTLLAGIIVFAAKQSEIEGGKNPTFVACAVMALPIIAVLLDCKLAEFGIHANIIDRFVRNHYREPSTLPAWELTKWGLGTSAADRWLIRLRTILTVSVTVIPTGALAILSALATKPFLAAGSYETVRQFATGFAVLYLLIGAASVRIIFFRR